MRSLFTPRATRQTNKWGQLLFETSNPGKGWDGENAIAGVYVWVIDYENRVGKAEQIKGTVAVVK